MLTEHKPVLGLVPTTDLVLVKAYEIGDLNHEAIHDIQLQIMELLKDMIKQYTQGDSTSVRVDVAEKILVSIHYVMDLYISSLPSFEEQLTCLKSHGIREVYRQGLTHIKTLLAEAKLLFSEVDKNMLNVPSEVYTDTFDKALPEFFKSYDIYFNAQDTMCSIDYPLIFDDASLQGITYIKHYLTVLKIETAFCSLFPTDDITTLLMGYGRKHRIDIINAPINLFELTFNNALFSFLSDATSIKLALSKAQFDSACASMSGLPIIEVPNFIDTAIQKMINFFQISEPLTGYIHSYKTVFVPRIVNALMNNTLSNIVIVKENAQEKLFFEKGIMMADETFREVVEELLGCMDSQEKLAILADKVHSIEDFIDILGADCLFGSEARDAFKILNEMELAVLSLIVFNEDLSTDFHLDPSLLQRKLIECEVPWQSEFLQFMQGLDSKFLKVLEEIILKIS